MEKPLAGGLPDWALAVWHRAIGTLDLRPYDLRRHANDTFVAVRVDYEIRTMLMGQKPPGQNPNYIDYTKPPATDRFREAIEAATEKITGQRRLKPKLAVFENTHITRTA